MNFLARATSMVTHFTQRGPPPVCEVVPPARLGKMTKYDDLFNFSCYCEGDTYYCIYLPLKSIVDKSQDQKSVRDLCSRLNPLPSLLDTKALEQLTLLVREEPDWGTLHYAVACGYTDFIAQCLRKEDKDRVVNYVTPGGILPLNIAANRKQLKVVKQLIEAGASMEKTDAMGKTVVHWAAASDETVLRDLADYCSFQRCLMILDSEGFSPLACAIRAYNLQTVVFLMAMSAPLQIEGARPLLTATLGLEIKPELLQIVEHITHISPTVVEQKDKSQSTILHLVKHKRLLQTILKHSYMSINANELDGTGSSPLICAVNKNNLECCLVLLSHGADTEIVNNDGKSALMAAVETGNEEIVKCLLLFGAKTSLENKYKQNVFHYSAQSPKRVKMDHILKFNSDSIVQDVTSVIDEFSQNVALEYQKTVDRSASEGLNLLSLDGGGIRGLVLIQMLIELDSVYDGNLLDKFSWIAGTSTGAILALALGQNRSLNECRNLYFRMKDDVFVGTKPYNALFLEKLLKYEYGETTTMAEISKDKRIFVTTCEGNIVPPKLKIYRTYPSPVVKGVQVEPNDCKTTPAWYAARCSSAAPYYFPAADNKWMDGGLVANNPTTELLNEVHKYGIARKMTGTEKPLRVNCVLSLGTGKAPVQSVEKVNFELPGTISGVFQAAGTIAHLKNLFIEQIASAECDVDRARAWTHSLPAPFFRFSPSLTKNVNLDETSDAVLVNMLWQTKMYMNSHALQVTQLVSYLSGK